MVQRWSSDGPAMTQQWSSDGPAVVQRWCSSGPAVVGDSPVLVLRRTSWFTALCCDVRPFLRRRSRVRAVLVVKSCRQAAGIAALSTSPSDCERTPTSPAVAPTDTVSRLSGSPPHWRDTSEDIYSRQSRDSLAMQSCSLLILTGSEMWRPAATESGHPGCQSGPLERGGVPCERAFSSLSSVAGRRTCKHVAQWPTERCCLCEIFIQ